jgi:hypothetical protein
LGKDLTGRVLTVDDGPSFMRLLVHSTPRPHLSPTAPPKVREEIFTCQPSETRPITSEAIPVSSEYQGQYVY